MATHMRVDNRNLCGTRSLDYTSTIEEVTCKRCISSFYKNVKVDTPKVTTSYNDKVARVNKALEDAAKERVKWAAFTKATIFTMDGPIYPCKYEDFQP